MLKRYFDYSPIRFFYLMAGGVGISIIIILQSYLVTGSEGNNFSGSLSHSILTFWKYAMWPFFVPAIQWVLIGLSNRKQEILTRYTVALFTLLALVSVHSLFSNILYYATKEWLGNSLSFKEMIAEYLIFFGPIFISRLADLALITIGLLLFNSYQNYSQAKLKLVELEKNLKESELTVLRNQIQPHFLFNTLNTISALIDQNPGKAQKVLSKTAGFLRVLLTQSDKSIVTFKEELRMISDYLSIETERFNDRLKVEQEVSEESELFQVPHFILQPIVENSIKHAVAKSTDLIIITVKSDVENEGLRIEISDNGPGANHESEFYSNGVGLRNVKKRLHHLYGKEAEIKIDTDKGKGFKVRLKLPKLLNA
ncbi:MAG: sensor histidine kinase [Balneola sp.]